MRSLDIQKLFSAENKMMGHPNSRKSLFYGIMAILWLTTVIVFYAYVHKPFSAETLSGILRAAWQVIVVLVILSLSGGAGARILGSHAEQSLTESVLQASLGLGLLSIVVLLIATTIGLSKIVLGGLLVLAFLLLGRNIRTWWQSWKNYSLNFQTLSKLEKTLVIFTGFLLACAFFISLAPPLRFDALTYHLSIPRSYILHGKISYLSDNVFSGMPELVEVLYTLSMLFGGTEAAPLLGWAMGFLCLVGIYDFSRAHFSSLAGWGAVAFLLTGETFTTSLASGYVEWPSMLFSISMVLALNNWTRDRRLRNIWLAGAFAGMALATKYTAGIMLVSGLAIILSAIKKDGARKTLLAALAFGMSGMLVVLPWLFKNALATGNPFYPLLIPAGAMDELRLAFYQKGGGDTNLWHTLTLPWQVTILGLEGADGYSASIGPLLLGFSLLACIGWKERTDSQNNILKISAIIVATGFLIWGIASQLAGLLNQSRLYFSMFPVWAILAGAGFNAVSRLQVRGIRFRRIASALVLLSLGFNTLQAGTQFVAANPLKVLVEPQGAREYMSANLGAYAKAMEVIDLLPTGSKVLMLWETRDFYCLPRCDGDEVIDRWYHDLKAVGKDSVVTTWKLQGYTHLLLFRPGADFIRGSDKDYTENDWKSLEEVLNSLPEPQVIGDSYWLFTLP